MCSKKLEINNIMVTVQRKFKSNMLKWDPHQTGSNQPVRIKHYSIQEHVYVYKQKLYFNHDGLVPICFDQEKSIDDNLNRNIIDDY